MYLSDAENFDLELAPDYNERDLEALIIDENEMEEVEFF